MFGLIKKILVVALFSSVNSLNVIPLKCVLIKNEECKLRKIVVNNEYMTYPYSIKVNGKIKQNK